MALNDPLNASDLILNGMGGMAINVVTDLYEGSVMKSIPGKVYAPTNIQVSSQTKGGGWEVSSKSDPSRVSKDFAKTLRNTLGLDEAEDIALKRRSGARPITNYVRNKIDNSKWAPGFLKQTKESIEEGALLEARQKATRRAVNNGTIKRLAAVATEDADKNLISQIMGANKVRGMGIMAIGVMGASAVSGLVQGTVRSMVDKGYSKAGSNTGFNSSVFLDNQMAYTTRQRALRAIHTSQSGLGRASGNEAAYLHSFR